MRSTRALSVVLGFVAVGALARPARAAILHACTAAQISSQNAADCPSSSAPCVISKDFTIDNGCTIDFGTRSVTVKGGTTLTVGANTATFKAGTFTVAAGGEINGRGDQIAPGDRGGFITIQTTGDVSIQKSTQLGRIDVSGVTAAGILRIVAGGNVTLQGKIIGNNLSTVAGGGNIGIDAAGNIISNAGSVFQAIGGDGVSGSIDLRAGGRVDLGAAVDLTGSDGGTLSISSGADTVVRGVNADATGDTGAGGEFDVSAGTTISIFAGVNVRGQTSSDGMAGGCGGIIDMESRYGDTTVSANLLADGASPDGGGGSITLAAEGSLALNAPATIAARGGGAQSCGGELDLSATRSVNAGATLDASAGAGGGSVSIVASASVTVTGAVLASAPNTNAFGGEVVIDAGEQGGGAVTISSTVDASGGNCDTLGFCGAGGVIDLFGCDVTINAAANLLAQGGQGGQVLLTAREQLRVNGHSTATKVAGPGVDGQNTFSHTSRKAPIITAGFVLPSPSLTPRATCTAFNVPVNCLPACPTCGNGVVEYPETCDTVGTPVSCDGCSLFCRLENCNDGSACTTDSCNSTLGCRNLPVADGTSCSDGLVCNGVESCLTGICLGTPPNCIDSNSCTADSCVEPGGCQHVNAPSGASCSDGNACTVGDTCNASAVCQSGPAAVCNDNRECTTDSCNPSTGCVFANRTGSCTDDGNPCTNDSCAGGNCTHPTLPNGSSCNDGAFCTVADTCQTGTCLGGGARDCSDPNPCTVDSCNESTDQCVHAPVSAGSSCTDGNACTVGDACDAGGTCQPGAAANCDDNNECTNDSCSPATGCAHTPRGGACTDDGNTCTSDVCTAGACTHPNRANGTSCEDGAFCTTADTCQNGNCAPGPVQSCSDSNSCTTDTCNEAADRCDHQNVATGTSCTDNDACTVGDACDNTGTCQSGAPANCVDASECTDDSCNPSTGCVHANRPGSCTDEGNPCTNDVCGGGICTHPAVANGISCSDGAFCTTADTCQGGTCAPGPARDCSDAIACTADSCNEATDACDHLPLSAGSPCSDGNACTVGDSCTAGGACQPGAPPNCNDNNVCTTDSCNPVSGCTHLPQAGACADDGNTCTTDVCNAGACTHPARPNGSTCDDGAFCTTTDACQGGVCVPGPARSCNDSNACTSDTCDEVNDTCAQTPIVPCCGDGATQSPEECDDANTVDTDACRNNCRLAVCGDGVVRTGFEECDQGAGNSNAPDAACRTDCRSRRCGDGVVDTAAGEQCDDGNALPGDGCDACFFEVSPTALRLPGKPTSTSECIIEFATEHPTLDRAGRPSFKQNCKDGDPACDFGTVAGECVFHVWLCANNHDLLLPACAPGPGGVGTAAFLEVKKPSLKSLTSHPEDTPLYNLVRQAATLVQSAPFDRCGPRLDVRVPLKAPLVKGTRALGVKATATGSLVDTDAVKLVCLP